jgi:hypothetical protein
MSEYNFVSPGRCSRRWHSSILAQARAEQRQKLIDEITAKNAASQRAENEQQIAASKAAMSRSQHQQDIEDLNVAANGLDVGEDLSNNPQLELFKRYGLVGPKPAGTTPVVSTSESVSGVQGQPDVPVDSTPTTITDAPTPSQTPPGTNYFVGRPEDRKRERVKRQVGDMISTLGDPNIPNWQRMLAIYNATEQDIPANAATSMQPEKPMFTVSSSGKITPVTDPSTHKPMTAPPGDSPFIHLPTPPQGAQPQFIGTDADGRPVFASGGEVFTHDKDGHRVPYNAALGAKPSSNTSANKLVHVPVNAVNSYKAAVNKVQQAQANAPLWGENTALTAAQQNMQSVQGSIISLVPNPELQGHLAKIIASPVAKERSTEEIVKQLSDYMAQQGKPIDPKTQQVIREILMITLGRVD